LEYPGPPGSVHLGLSYDQWVAVLMHRQRMGGQHIPGAVQVILRRYPAYARALAARANRNFRQGLGGNGAGAAELGDFGSGVCTSLQEDYLDAKAQIKKEKKREAGKGKKTWRWYTLGLRVADKKKYIKKLQGDMGEAKREARNESCSWTGRKSRKKKVKKLEREEKELEVKLAKDTRRTEKALRRATRKAVKAQEVQAAQPTQNPVLILGGVAVFGLLMFVLVKKK
tara:strand:- start:17 stop:697 length:681 start_codon:yes stop_codon:yes gene_type:complete